MKIKLLLVALIPLLLMGCDMNDLFDEGDTLKSYDGPTVLEFSPLEQEVGIDGGQASVKIQLIGPQQDSDLSVEFSVEGSAEAGTHYTISTPSPVTLEAGTSSVDVVIELIEDSLEDGEEETLILNLEGAGDIEPSPELATATIFIQG